MGVGEGHAARAEGACVYFRVLGPIELWHRDRRFPLGTLKEQHVLAVLLLEAGRVVSIQALADCLWDDHPPRRARQTLQVYVSRLRRHLKTAGHPTGPVSSSAFGGYRLDVPLEQIDVQRFDQLLVQARAAGRKPDPASARALLREAETLWRGEALSGLTGPWADATRQVLHERRRNATLTRIELELSLGSHADGLISELMSLSAVGPIDQKAVGLLMRALDDAGRQGEALAAYRRAHERLRDELGVDPRVELRALHQRILRGESTPAATPAIHLSPVIPAPDTLDRDPLHLVGREAELEDLLSAIAHDLRTTSSIALYALDGMPGIGKTALAVRAAHRLRQHCPDGALQLNLRTHHPHQPPLDSRGALIRLLEDLATPAAEIGRADGVDTLAALWRRRSSGRRLLLLLDDVTSAEQIAPLLPATTGSIVLLTSRHRLATLDGARHHTLNPLTSQAGKSLLTSVVGRETTAAADDVAHYLRRCGGVPLAITVTAAYLRARPHWTLADLNERLDGIPPTAHDSLTEPIHVAFAMSYQALSAPIRSLLRRLAAQPGQDIGVHATAAITEASLSSARLALDVLVERHLLEEIERDRYRLHDLTREFALTRIHEENDEPAIHAALTRLLDFYLQATVRAEHTLRPHRRMIKTPDISPPFDTPALDTTEQARRWLERESDNLTAVAAYAHTHLRHPHAVLMPLALAQHLDRRGRWRQAADMLQRAVNANAASAPTPSADAAQTMTDLAAALVRTGELDAALGWASTALDTWITQDDTRGQADALLEIGRIHWYNRRLAAAHDAYLRSAHRYEHLRDRRGRAVADYHRSIIQFELGNSEDALHIAKDLLETARSLDDAGLECDVLTNLGEMHRLSGRFDQALEYFQAALHLAEELADPHNLAVLGNNVGAVYVHIGDLPAAMAAFSRAIRLFKTLGDGRNLIDTLVHLAGAYLRAGAHADALEQLNQGSALAAQLRDPLRHARVHLAIGQLQRALNHHAEAIASCQAALDYARRASALLEQAQALHALGDLLDAQGDITARDHWLQAAELYRQLDHPDATQIPN